MHGVRIAAKVALVIAVVVGNALVLRYLGLVSAVVYTVVAVAVFSLAARRPSNRK